MTGAPIVEASGDKWRAVLARLSNVSALWRLRGSVELAPEMTDQQAITRLAQLLERQRKEVSERGDDWIGFDGTLDLANRNWRSMAHYHRGRFWIEREREGRTLRYDLSSLHAMIFGLGAALCAYAFRFDDGVGSALFLAAFAFTFVYGLNLLIALARVPGAVREVVGAG